MYGFLTLRMTFLVTVALCQFASADQTKIRTVQAFKEFMEKHPEIRHLEDVLPHLDPDVFSAHEAMVESRSQQGASLEFPRLIYFNKRSKLYPAAQFTIALNGDPSQVGYDTLEMIEFHDSPQATMEFHKHVFRGDTERMIAYRKAHALDEKIPALRDCRSCHRADSRYNWDEYNIRPGVLSDVNGLSQKMRDAHESFYKNAPGHPRYKTAASQVYFLS